MAEVTKTLTRHGLCGTQAQLISVFVASIFLADVQTQVSQGQPTDLQQTFLQISCCQGVDARWARRMAAKLQHVLGGLKGLFDQHSKWHRASGLAGGLHHDLCTLSVNLIPFPLYSRDAIIMSTASSRSDPTSFAEKGHVLCCDPSGPAGASANLRSWTPVHSSRVALLATFCVESTPWLQAFVEFIVKKSSTSWSYTHITALHHERVANVHVRQHTLQYVVRNIRCVKVNLH